MSNIQKRVRMFWIPSSGKISMLNSRWISIGIKEKYHKVVVFLVDSDVVLNPIRLNDKNSVKNLCINNYDIWWDLR